jgi:hypothetical protein
VLFPEIGRGTCPGERWPAGQAFMEGEGGGEREHLEGVAEGGGAAGQGGGVRQSLVFPSQCVHDMEDT